MNGQLTLQLLFDRARQLFSQQQISSHPADGPHSFTYGEWAERTARLAHGLYRLGIRPGDRVATLAWNHHRHLEAYFAVALMGATYHTVNPRLPADQLRYILSHAHDRVLLVDLDLWPLVEPLWPELPSLQAVVVMGAPSGSQTRPLHEYESLLADRPTTYDWPSLDEWAPAGICYTSGTTGAPKGVVYSHRALYLHAMMLCMGDAFAIRERDVLMPIVPMFHVNAWGFPYAAILTGAKLVLPGKFTPERLAQLIETERVTVAPGVPSVWLAMVPLIESGRFDLSSLRLIPCGGAAVPPALTALLEARGIRVGHAYGMTEGGPVTHISVRTAELETLSPVERAPLLTRQGRPAPGVSQRLIGPDGAELPWDGQSPGELLLRGPWVAGSYLDDPRSAEAFMDGWYHTGDVATIDPDGTMQIVDRLKDLVKSGGEWISSVALEGALMGAPGVLEAAVIACPHPKWEERPLALVVRRPVAGAEPAGADSLPVEDETAARSLQAYLRDRFPSFWVPDQIRFVPAIPKGATGKVEKGALRQTWQSVYSP